jgi:hypothetical protein
VAGAPQALDGARRPGGERRSRALAGGREGMRSDAPRAWEGAIAVNEERETGF